MPRITKSVPKQSIAGKLSPEYQPSATRPEREDQWAHRSTGMRCATCMWFAPKMFKIDPKQEKNTVSFGRCRRHAPTMSGYPAVFGLDWCGDHKLDENKI